MKTPDEIKKGLKICFSTQICSGCPYSSDDCMFLGSDAFEYIQQLEAALTEAKNDSIECIVEEELW